MSLLDYFPRELGEPRETQVKILKSIKRALNQDKKYIVLKAGTGTGKSAVAVTLAKYFGNAYIVTGTKDLQNQYHKDFGFKVMYGRSNFDCKTMIGMFEGAYATCDNGFCQKDDKFRCENGVKIRSKDDFFNEFAFESPIGDWVWRESYDTGCYYWKQKADAINAPITLMNYASYFLEMNRIPIMTPRKLVVFDESQNIENVLMQNLGTKISNRVLAGMFEGVPNFDPPKFTEEEYKDDSGSDRSFDNWIERLHEVQRLLERVLEINESEGFASGKLDKDILKRIQADLQKLETIKYELRHTRSNWVLEFYLTDKYKEPGIQIQPVWIAPYTKNYMFDHADDCALIMSATIPPKKYFCKWYGLDEKEVAFLDYESPFPLENRPITIIDRGRLSGQSLDKTFNKLPPIVDAIMQTHPNEKGIIHTQSNKLTKRLYSELKDKKRIVGYSGHDGQFRNRREVIDAFKASDGNQVLIAPGIKEGVDLPYDMCRFQIIFKIPYPYLGDAQIKARNQSDKAWYNYKTVNDFEQAYGRGMRAYDDYCKTYIVDGSVNHIAKSRFTRRFLSNYLKEALDTAERL